MKTQNANNAEGHQIMSIDELQSVSMTAPTDISPHRDLRKLLTVRNILLTLLIASSAVMLITQSLAGGNIASEHVYDDGVYFAASLNVVHGIIPYKDFIFLQPPLMTIWLAPFSLISHVTGTRWAFEAARLFTDLISVADLCLVAFLLRNRSTIRQILGVGIIAYSENMLWGSRTILIEPYLVALCLAAYIALLNGETITDSRRRMWIVGILFGLAGATKIWAIFPMLAALIIIWKIRPNQRLRLVLGTATGFIAAVAPFALLVPGKFLSEVVFTQALRGANGLGIEARLQDLSGIPDIFYLQYISATLAIIVLLAIYLLAAILIVASLKGWRQRPGTHLELLAATSTVLIGISFLLAHSYFSNYGFFMAPFISLSLATISYPFKSLTSSRSPLKFKVIATGTVAFILLTFAWQDSKLATRPGLALITTVPAQVSTALGNTGCLWSANPGIAILANRYTGDQAACPHTVDWGGTELLFVHDYNPAKIKNNPAIQQDFLRFLHKSDRVFVNWNYFGATEMAYLNSHFHKVSFQQSYHLAKIIYFRNGIPN